MIKSAWGSDDPTKAALPFLHGDALSEAGHEIQIFLLGEAVSLMRKSVAKCGRPCGLAAAVRNAHQNCYEEDPDLRMRGLLSRQGRDRSGAE